MRHKYVNVTATALAEVEMVALASTFGNTDRQGDRVVRGAFSSAVANVKAGVTIPLIWGHDASGSPQNFVGEIVDADETSEGLEVHACFDLDDPVARKAWRLVKSGAIDKLSIGYSVRRERRASDGATELLDVNLKEVSLVMNPANERARVLAIKGEGGDDVPSHAELEVELIRAGIIARPASHTDYQRLDPAVTGTGLNGDEREKSIRNEERRRMLTLLDESDKAIKPAAESQQPLQIASFECC